MSILNVDPSTGEIVQNTIAVEVEQQLVISIDADMVRTHHHDPKFIAEQISLQAGSPVFDISKAKGKKECASHAAKVIKTIAPVLEISKSMAAEAKKVVQQDLTFRRDIEPMIRFIAAEIRKPLTEWETEQKRIEEEQKERERIQQEAEQYDLDWQDAINLDELYTLRKAAEMAQAKADAEAKEIADKLAFDAAVALKAEQQRDELERLSRQRFEQEQAEKLMAERAEIRRQELEKVELEAKEEAARREREKRHDEMLKVTCEVAAKHGVNVVGESFTDKNEIEPTIIEPKRFSKEAVIELVMQEFNLDFLDAEQCLYEVFGDVY